MQLTCFIIWFVGWVIPADAYTFEHMYLSKCAYALFHVRQVATHTLKQN